MGKLTACKTCGAQISKNAKRCPQCGEKNVAVGTIVSALLCVCVIFIAIVLVVVVMIGNNDQASTNPSAGQDEENVIEVTANELYDAYAENSVNADELYKNKVIQVTGTVTDIGQDMLSEKPCISLDSGSAYNLAPIQCFFNEATSDIASLHDGDVITIRGECTGVFVSVVQLSKCEIIVQ